MEKKGREKYCALNNGFGGIPYFLEITYVGEVYLIFEKISVLPKAKFNNQAQQIENTKVFCKTLKCFATH
jgi:hypothetical protein